MNGFALAISKNSVIVDIFQKMQVELSEATKGKSYISIVYKRSWEENAFFISLSHHMFFPHAACCHNQTMFNKKETKTV